MAMQNMCLQILSFFLKKYKWQIGFVLRNFSRIFSLLFWYFTGRFTEGWSANLRFFFDQGFYVIGLDAS